MKKPLLFAVNAEGIDSEKEGEALIILLIPGLCHRHPFGETRGNSKH